MKTIHTIHKQLPSNRIFNNWTLLLLALFLFAAPGYTQLTVSTTNGNVGIKTTEIKDALTVNGHTSFRNAGTRYLKFDNTWNGGLDPGIDINGFLWKASGQAGYGSDTIRYYQLYNYEEDKLFFDADNNIINGAHMVIQRDGNVGIGTTDPLNKLHVEGDALFSSAVGDLKFGFPTGNGWGLATIGGGSDLILASYTNTSTEAGFSQKVLFKGNGTNGFGTSNPQRVLHAESSGAGGALRLTRTGSTVILDAGAELNEASMGTTSNHPFRLMTNNAVRMQIQADGNVGIGTTSAAFPLTVNGNAYISGDLTVASDVQLKEDIRPVRNALGTIGRLNPVTYRYRVSEFPELRLSENNKIGLIAQELEEILPELVTPAGKALRINGESVDLKSVNYLELIPVLIAGIQELEATVSEKEDQIETLSKRLEKVESLLVSLKAAKQGLDN